MKFKVFDNKTGKEADSYEIALHEEWAQGLVYCDMEGFAILEDGSLILLDECGNFRYCDGDRFIVDIYQEKGDEVVELDRPHGEWIPVSERLPEENKTVIASTKYGVCSEARYSKEYGWEWAYESGADYWEELKEVNAWMPLPEPYREEGDEK